MSLFSILRERGLIYKHPTLLEKRPSGLIEKLLRHYRGVTTSAGSSSSSQSQATPTASFMASMAHQGAARVTSDNSDSPLGSPAPSLHDASSHSSSNSTAAGDQSAILLRVGDVLFFQGDFQQLQEHAQRLDLVILTSDLTPLPEAVSVALEGPLPYAALVRHSPRKADTAAGKALQMTQKHLGLSCLNISAGDKGENDDDDEDDKEHKLRIAPRSSAIGWSGASLWMFRVRGALWG